ncbi:RHS repeat domain-containing protein [Pseudoxanthomonas sp. 22568]|uniref:RHS repeat domain-containing protein n=1 Tax=Pseudoxanthomonas sp. 22568 TaxID=3453945 RepID=UPI003F858C91
MKRTGKQRMKRMVVGIVLALPLAAQAQTYSKTESIEYHDNTTSWVLGQTSKVTCVAPAECTPSWAPTGIVMSETTYDTLARPVTVKSFGLLKQTLTYHADGTLATVKDANNNITTFGSWKRGIPQTVSYADSTGQSAVVDDRGWIAAVTDETGAKTCYAYDAMGRLASITYPSEAANGVCDGSTWTPRTSEFRAMTAADWKPPGFAVGQWRRYENQGNYVKLTYYDALWRPLLSHEYDSSNTTGTVRATSAEYDSEGRVTFQSYPSSSLVPAATGTWSFYDALGRVTQVKQDSELGQLTTTTEYLSGFKTRLTNPRGQQTLTIYQAFDQPTYDYPTGIDHPEGASTEIHRNVFGNVTALRRRNATASEQVWRYYVYQADQQLCKSIEPETGATVYGYDWAGNLTHSASGLQGFGDITACNHPEAWASGRVVSRTYDARNRLKSLIFPDSQGNQTWYYWPTGAVQTIVTDNDGPGQGTVTNHYSYNKRGLLVGESVTQSGWYSWGIQYRYDGLGNPSGYTTPDQLNVNYQLNALGQPLAVTSGWGTHASGISYYPNGAIKQFTYGNGIVHTMDQNVRQLPIRTVDGAVQNLVYSYDGHGNVEAIGDYVQGGGDGSHSRWMTYDGLDRLTNVGSCMFGGDCWHRFTYNTLDNLTSWKLAGVKDYATYVYDAGNRLTSIQNSAAATIVGLSYDPQGNLANKNGQAYRFDFGNRLREVTGKESYRYDGYGRRLSAKNPAKGDVLSMYGQNGQLIFRQDWRRNLSLPHIYLGSSLLATIEWNFVANTGELRYQHTDALGSPTVVTNASGQIVERNNYEPYGVVIGKPNYDGIGFTGHVQDATTGLTYMQQRYYDPQVGRFLSVDPVTAYASPGANFNRYWYANNSPYNFTDPDGRQTCTARYGCGWQPAPFNLFTDTFSGRMWSDTVGDTIALFRSDGLNPLSGEFRSAGQLQDAKFNLLLSAAPFARFEATGVQSAKGVLEQAVFAQRTFREAFGNAGRFAGKTIDEVAGALRSGRLSVDEVPIQYIVRDGSHLILNTRSAQALQRAGVPRAQWNAQDMTGNAAAEMRLTEQLRRNRLDSGGIGNPSSGK